MEVTSLCEKKKRDKCKKGSNAGPQKTSKPRCVLSKQRGKAGLHQEDNPGVPPASHACYLPRADGANERNEEKAPPIPVLEGGCEPSGLFLSTYGPHTHTHFQERGSLLLTSFYNLSSLHCLGTTVTSPLPPGSLLQNNVPQGGPEPLFI